MILFLTILSGLAWTLVYIESIGVGFRQQTYAMPVAAVALNFAWESTYSAHDLSTDPSVQAIVNLVWALADLVIIYTFFRFGRRELPAFVSRPLFIAMFVARRGARGQSLLIAVAKWIGTLAPTILFGVGARRRERAGH